MKTTRVFVITSMLSISASMGFAQNVGVGQTTPIEKLDVNGAIRIGSTSSSNAGSIRYVSGSQKFQVNISGTWYDLATGNLAYINSFSFNPATNILTIVEGSTTHTVDLTDLQDPDDQNLTLSGNTLSIDNGNSVSLSGFLDNTDDQTLSEVYQEGGNNVQMNAADGNVRFYKSGSEILMLQESSGRVGIGTQLPEAKLNLYSASSATQGDITTQLPNTGLLISSNYGLDNYSPGVFWATPDNNATKPKGGIYMKYENSGSAMILGTSTSYTSGLTNEAIFINSEGNVGIGTNAPTSRLHVSSATSGDAELIIEADTDDNNENDNPYITFKQDGNLVNAFIGLEGDAGTRSANTTSNAFILGTETTNSHMQFVTSDAVRMTIESGGEIGIGMTNPSYTLHVNGKIKTTGINESSDLRLKKNINDIPNALDNIMAMRGVTYEWRKDEYPEMELDEGVEYGLIAQELEKILPDLVETDKEGWKSIEYSHIVPLLIEAIKEQQATIDSQKDRINSLEGLNAEVEALKASIKNLEDLHKTSQE